MWPFDVVEADTLIDEAPGLEAGGYRGSNYLKTLIVAIPNLGVRKLTFPRFPSLLRWNYLSKNCKITYNMLARNSLSCIELKCDVMVVTLL